MERAGFDAWLAALTAAGPSGLHGSTLVDAMTDAAAGRWFVGPSDADDALRRAEARGQIRRGPEPCPTTSQAAAIGLAHSPKSYRDVAQFYGSHWHWWRAR